MLIHGRGASGDGLLRHGRRRGGGSPITGTAPVLAAMTDGDDIADFVTWGSYASTEGTIVDPTVKQMSNDGVIWDTFATTAVVFEETWQVREIVTDTAANERTFTSAVSVIGLGPAPDNTVLPAISGSPVTDQTITVSTGTWTSGPAVTFSYQWFLNDEEIFEANAPSLLITEAYLGGIITATVTGSSIFGSETVSASNSVGPVVGPGDLYGERIWVILETETHIFETVRTPTPAEVVVVSSELPLQIGV